MASISNKLKKHSWQCDQGIKDQVPYQWCSHLDLVYLPTVQTLMLVCVFAGARSAWSVSVEHKQQTKHTQLAV